MEYIKWLRGKVGQDYVILNFAGAIIQDKLGRLLLQKRGDNHQWGFPGGCIEIGESAEETVIREVKEETGFDININGMIGVYSKYFHEYPNGDKAQTICVFFDCSLIGGEMKIDQSETLELEFFDIEQIPPLFHQQHCDALEDFLNNKRGVYR
ncbi:NUDIX hydrolase [Pontibacillus marinus]|uniref:MutT/nudix family protein n=1 Tax=Pontibacillus marinus BH030004 = DSM 16465 TaxID=1385511 RepID=A0A0A5FTQ7_9BACI|nr:NUDIX domain-containing protein [Pontibacillus marinus]KGX84151.1 mutT/nudix family protein [Pontibacillus marinus BH030004 = DSM 16465]